MAKDGITKKSPKEQENKSSKPQKQKEDDVSGVDKTVIKPGGIYLVVESYKACDNDDDDRKELSVDEGDQVECVSRLDQSWAIVKNPKTGDQGSVPIDVLCCITSVAPAANFCTKLIIPVLVALLVSLIGSSAYYLSDVSQEKQFCNLKCEIDQLEDNFKQHEDLWITLESCLEGAMSGEHPCVITLLNGRDYDQTHLHRTIGQAAWRLFNVTQNELIHHVGSDLKETGFSFEECKSELAQRKIMLISEMENIPGPELLKFHSICDFYDPAVKQAVIIFMLNFKDIKLNRSERKDNELAFDLINEHWKNSIHRDVINALTTRITENAVKLV